MGEATGGVLGLFGKIRQQDDAARIVRASSLAFFIAGGVFMVLSYWFGPELWLSGAAYLVLGFLLRQFRSRVIATLLLLLALTSLLLALKVFAGHWYSAGVVVIVSAIVVAIGARAVEATFTLRAGPGAPKGDA
jgi:hypothetical protein